MNAFATIALVAKLLPIITTVVRDIEDIDQSAGKGQAKLSAAVAIIKGLYEASGAEKPFDDLSAAVVKVIAAVVDFYNNIGIFKKKTVAA